MTGEGRRDSVVPPPVAAPRLFGVDTARGVALLGMFVAHTVFGGGEKIVDGRSAILFATVAGVSLGLLSGAAKPPASGARSVPRLVILARGTALIVLGVGLTVALDPPVAVILDYYGFGFLMMLGVLFLPRALLGLLAVVFAIAGPPVVRLVTGAAPFDTIPEVLQLFARWLVSGDYPMVVWLAYLLAGLALARSDLSSRRTALTAAAVGTVCAVLGYTLARVVPGATAAAHSDSTFEVLGSGGVAVAVIGILSLLDSVPVSATDIGTGVGVGERLARVVRFVLAPVAAAGAMALTLYTAHVVFLAVVRAAVEQHGRWEVPDWVLPVLIVVSLVVAPLWRRFLGAGPLERAMRAFARLIAGSPRTPKVAA